MQCLSSARAAQQRLAAGAADRVLDQFLEKPVGVVATDDDYGLQVLDVCRTLEMPVPDEVAVMGNGNDQFLCDMSIPPLEQRRVNP